MADEASRLASAVSGRLESVRERIQAAGGDPAAVTILAVTKGFGPAVCLAAEMVGLRQLGENYADELLAKAAALEGEDLRWHFIGRIQRNKVARLAPLVSCWQSVSRAAEADAIASRTHSRPPTVFLEVNLADDPARPGCPLGEVPALAEHVADGGLGLRGLMAVAPLAAGAAEVGRLFRSLAELNSSLGLAELSIGMSGDLEEAVRAGSTMVRLGTALFGPRDSHTARRVLQE